MSDHDLQETKYGFWWGPLMVERMFGDDCDGVVVEIRTPRQEMMLRITPSGFIRVGEIRKTRAVRFVPFENNPYTP